MVPVRLIDSHTEGEPTRVLVDGGPSLRASTMIERVDELRADWDHLRTAIAAEPRAPEGAVVAFLTPPVTADAIAGVIFANRADYLSMCGHGSIGVARTLVHLGRIPDGPGRFALDTPAGAIAAELFDDASVEIRNVASRAYRLDVELDLPDVGTIAGDIAYGGNWFFLVDVAKYLAGVELGVHNAGFLTHVTQRIRDALRARGITGEDGATIDHVELFGPPRRPDADATNFVLCPDGAYDRSPCGTGTSAKMAVLAARGALQPGDVWRQESVTGGLFTGRIAASGNDVVPYIRGRAFVSGETTLFFDPKDPFRYGIVPGVVPAR
ncbi:MAG TPA: proline racemase family protein [Candidatus Baltobacteraceae bacterium]|jgi:4-hydroxyproline epimerase|nr:proline racemase family protein [Candidatus Baltobacteraceae bacterium]